MLQYMLLLGCLYAALTDARPVKPKKTTLAAQEKNITDEINGGLKEFMSRKHHPFIPLIKVYNEGIRLTLNPRIPVALELIRDSDDFEKLLTSLGIDTRNNSLALKHFSSLKPFYQEVDRIIDRIPDHTVQEDLQREADASKIKIQQRLQPKKAISPKKISSKKARQEKFHLMRFVNYQLSSQQIDKVENEDLKDAISFATVHNIALVCKQKEYRGYNADKILAAMGQYSSSPVIDIPTARRYKANNEKFFKSLIRSFHGLEISTLCDETEELIEELPEKLSDALVAQILDGLKIGFGNDQDQITDDYEIDFCG